MLIFVYTGENMIQVAVVEDDPFYRKTIMEYLEKYENEFSTRINITVFTDGEDIVKEYKHFDIILMDIKMFGMDGMSAAAEIRKIDSEVVIIFITSTPPVRHGGIQG